METRTIQHRGPTVRTPAFCLRRRRRGAASWKPGSTSQKRLAVEHGANDFRACGVAGGWHGKLDQLAQDLVLCLAHKRDFDALRCQEIGQHFSAVSREA